MLSPRSPSALELDTYHAEAQYAREEVAVGSIDLERADQLVAAHAVHAHVSALSHPIGFMVSRLSETSNVVSLRTVSPVEPAAVEGGLVPGTAVFATMLICLLVIGRIVTPVAL